MQQAFYNPDTNVELCYTDDAGKTHTAEANLSKGKLLIPLGACKGWLLDHHSSITVQGVTENGAVELPTIQTAKLLKIREVGND